MKRLSAVLLFVVMCGWCQAQDKPKAEEPSTATTWETTWQSVIVADSGAVVATCKNSTFDEISGELKSISDCKLEKGRTLEDLIFALVKEMNRETKRTDAEKKELNDKISMLTSIIKSRQHPHVVKKAKAKP